MIHLRGQQSAYPPALEESRTEILCDSYAERHRAPCELPAVIGPGAGTQLRPKPPLPLLPLLESTQLDLRTSRAVS